MSTHISLRATTSILCIMAGLLVHHPLHAEDAALATDLAAPVQILLSPQSADVELPPFTTPTFDSWGIQELLPSSTPPYQGAAAPSALPLLAWPMTHLIGDRNILYNYPDDDPTAAVKDYEGLTHAQDTRVGTDLLLFNFREMDRGYPVIAAAEGSITGSVYDKVDRTYAPPYPDDGNLILVRHGTGLEHTLYHQLRTNSNTVEIGDTVHVGDTISMIGSSGNTAEVGLNFQPGDFTPFFVAQDPWNGAFQTNPSLWIAQQPYIGSDPMKVWDLTYSTQTAVGGNVASVPAKLLHEGLSQPDTVGDAEPWIYVVMLIQGQATDSFTLRVVRPDAIIYGSISNVPLGIKRRALRQSLLVPWGGIPGFLYGTWKLQVLSQNVIIAEAPFEVNANTSFTPRFYPIEGRSIRLTGVEQRDTLRSSSLGGAVTYSLVNQPSCVSLMNDSVVVFDAVSTTTMRSSYFQAIATDGSGRVDTMWYHIVDPSRPWKCFTDSDGDGFGDIGAPGTTGVTDIFGVCLPGTADNNDDCDDSDPAINPGATELCDGIDNNCDGQIDEGVTTTYYLDSDGDGFGDLTSSTEACSTPLGYVDNSLDCDDADAGVNPGATEICDGIDNNCDGQTDEGLTTTYYLDLDGDGFGRADSSVQACSLPGGYAENDIDCDDTDLGVNPGATEICDGIDNNCDGQTDEGLTTTYYIDDDNDGFGRADSSIQACSLPGGYAENDLDCDDTDLGVNPAATEICDGVDNNCDGQTDEGVLITYYEDADSDGFGSTAVSLQACALPPGYVAAGGDCDDGDASTYPGAVEYCNGVDNDCNTLVDDNCTVLCPIVMTGDVNESGTLTSADIIAMVNFVFKGGATPQPCEAAADINCSGTVTSADIIGMVNHVFKGGTAPCDVCTMVPDPWSCP